MRVASTAKRLLKDDIFFSITPKAYLPQRKEEKKKAYRLLKYEGGESLTMKKLKNITRRQYLNQP